MSLRRPLKFGAAGVLNTAFGLGIIYAARAIGAGELAANAIGYGAGWALSLALQGYWVFADRRVQAGSAWRFGAITLMAWLANAGVVFMLLLADLEPAVTHLAGLPVYVVLLYLGAERWAFAAVNQSSPPTHGSNQP